MIDSTHFSAVFHREGRLQQVHFVLFVINTQHQACTEKIGELLDRQIDNGDHLAPRPTVTATARRLDREPERLALLLPIPRHLVMPTTQRL